MPPASIHSFYTHLLSAALTRSATVLGTQKLYHILCVLSSPALIHPSKTGVPNWAQAVLYIATVRPWGYGWHLQPTSLFHPNFYCALISFIIKQQSNSLLFKLKILFFSHSWLPIGITWRPSRYWNWVLRTVNLISLAWLLGIFKTPQVSLIRGQDENHHSNLRQRKQLQAYEQGYFPDIFLCIPAHLFWTPRSLSWPYISRLPPHTQDLTVFHAFLPALAWGCASWPGNSEHTSVLSHLIKASDSGPLWDHLPGNVLFLLTSQSLAVSTFWTPGPHSTVWS